jgi:hypothetical protein
VLASERNTTWKFDLFREMGEMRYLWREPFEGEPQAVAV